MLVVKEATVEIIKPHELKKDDTILYMNTILLIRELNPENRKEYFLGIDLIGGEWWLPRWLHFYRIKNVITVNVCTDCSGEVEEGNLCPDCEADAIDYAEYQKATM